MKGSGQFRVTIGFFPSVLATVIAPYFSSTFSARLFCHLEILYIRKLLDVSFTGFLCPKSRNHVSYKTSRTVNAGM
jgi:hypothetical protein